MPLKVLIILVLALAGGGYAYTKNKEKEKEKQRQEALNPEVIANPVYAEIRFTFDAGGRAFEMVLLAKTTGDTECNSAATGLGLIKRQVEAAQWKIKSSECKPALDPRYAAMFDNRPTHLTYLRIARGAPNERDMRMISWGLSGGESDKLCDGLAAEMRRSLKGAVTCVRGVQP
jgi:hypothetical protein